ncbi:hypothetical protein MPL3356_110167 [Mesorhizobium plurifarium]|uniref:Uncharacterized protein n=1 Tax=Mesorhizobium plurifarium TaxID=69974 RepID=A0A090D9Y5_MESPL|nr:hypothetical protein MPL3356_110167 [Mesorhizobium plurifarium]
MIDERGDSSRLAQIRVREQIPASGELLCWRKELNECFLRVAEGSWQRRHPNSCLHRRQGAEHAGVAVDDPRTRHRDPQPFRNPMVLHDPIEPDHCMVGEVADAHRTPVLLNIRPAGIDRPNGIANLGTDELFVYRLARAEGNVSLSFAEIEIPVAGDELYRQVWIAFIKTVQQASCGYARYGWLQTRVESPKRRPDPGEARSTVPRRGTPSVCKLAIMSLTR